MPAPVALVPTSAAVACSPSVPAPGGSTSARSALSASASASYSSESSGRGGGGGASVLPPPPPPPPVVLVQAVVTLGVPAQCLAAPAPLCSAPQGWARVCGLLRALTGPTPGYMVSLQPLLSGVVEEDRDSISDSVDLDRDDSFRSVLSFIWEFHGMEELASVACNRCKTSVVPIYRLQSESSRLYTCLFPPCLVLSLRTQIWPWPNLWKTRPFTGFSLFPVVDTGGIIGPPPLFLARIPSRQD